MIIGQDSLAINYPRAGVKYQSGGMLYTMTGTYFPRKGNVHNLIRSEPDLAAFIVLSATLNAMLGFFIMDSSPAAILTASPRQE